MSGLHLGEAHTCILQLLQLPEAREGLEAVRGPRQSLMASGDTVSPSSPRDAELNTGHSTS